VSRRIALAACAGLAFVALEVAADLVRPVPLDAAITPIAALATAAGLAAAMAAVTALSGRLGARAVLPAALLWAAVWGPDGARASGALEAGVEWAGWVPVALIALLGVKAPRAALVLGVLGALWIPALRDRGGGAQVSEVAPAGPNVLVITVDTLRADAAGWRERVTPPAEWAVFTQAISPAPWTLPAMHSLLTAEGVVEHGGGLRLGADTYSRRHPRAETWIETLRSRGYRTEALVSNPHIRRNNGFDDGFSAWSHADSSRRPLALWHSLERRQARMTGRRAPLLRSADARLTEAALRRIRDVERPTLLWVHLMGVHEYARDRPGDTPREVLRAAYAQAVSENRERLSALTDAAQGWVVALTSDHGEAFWEAGWRGHGRGLHDPELRVPLALRGPSVIPGERPGLVTTADLGPTLVELTSGEPAPGRHLWIAQDSVDVGGVRREPERFSRRDGDGRYTARDGAVPAGAPEELDADVLRALRAMGYVEP